jgi:hypothetical protein
LYLQYSIGQDEGVNEKGHYNTGIDISIGINSMGCRRCIYEGNGEARILRPCSRFRAGAHASQDPVLLSQIGSLTSKLDELEEQNLAH